MQTIDQLRSGALTGIKRLKLACGLTEFPPEIFELADTLEVLDLSGNALSSLPDDLTQLSRLHILFCSDNQFTELPEVLGRCPNLSLVGFKANRIRAVPAQSLPPKLRWLILTDNRIEALPDEIGRCAQLQKLMLAGNRLRSLPESLAGCSRLELLRVAANQLTGLPRWLFALPRLSWLAYAGNPFSEALETKVLTDTPTACIPWDSLDLHHPLGEGASGVIHRAEHRGADGGARPVAVKLFKGAVTSDGWPHCEMAACLGASQHPNLIPLLGQVNDHPTGAHGLVMALIDAEFKNLAGPPSLESCTRDIYPPDARFDLATALRIAYGIASAAQHLHRQGIMHGDLYGHNILHCGQGQALIGDFGAASFYSNADPSLADSLQRVEARAFGCLLEELIERIDAVAPSDGIMCSLKDLKAACLGEVLEERPLFLAIELALAALLEQENDQQRFANKRSNRLAKA